MSTPSIQIVDLSEGPFDNHTDCSSPKQRFLQGLANHGIKTVIRYYSDQNNLPCKNITVQERQLLHSFGFSVAIVYQYNGRMPGRYTAATGRTDGAFCLGKANELRQPDGSALYFGIDADTAVHDPGGVIDYFTEINTILGARFRIGCYAPGAICAEAQKQKLVSYTWVPEAPAWSGTRDFINSGHWTMYQNKTDMRSSELSKGHGIDVDTDIVSPTSNTIGAFDQHGNIAMYAPADVQAIAAARMWVNQAQMPIFDAPGGHQIGHMCIARMVTVLARVNVDWVSVDINEDGRSEGVCQLRSLSPLQAMPAWTPGCTPIPL